MVINQRVLSINHPFEDCNPQFVRENGVTSIIIGDGDFGVGERKEISSKILRATSGGIVDKIPLLNECHHITPCRMHVDGIEF